MVFYYQIAAQFLIGLVYFIVRLILFLKEEQVYYSDTIQAEALL